MTHEEMEQELDQAILSVGFAHDFKIYLMEEHLCELEPAAPIPPMSEKDRNEFLGAIVFSVFWSGIFWGVLAWRIFA